VLTDDTRIDPPLGEPQADLVRQAYLLTGDADAACRLADRAASAGRLHARRHGAAEGAEYAKAELVRSFVADPGERSQRPAPPGSAVHPDVSVWQALCRLSPRRRAAIVLRYDEGLSEEEAAARLGTSAQIVRADMDAAMLTLRASLPGVADPWSRTSEALSAAGRGWSEYTRPAAARVAEVLASPPPLPRADRDGDRDRHRQRLPQRRGPRPVTAVVIAAIALLLGTAVVVPRMAGDRPAPGTAAVPVPAGQQGTVRGAPRPLVPSIDVADGLLNWPARGRLAADDALLAAATKAWKAGVPAAEAPATAVGVLWAGTLDRRTVAVLQGLDRAGRPHLAQVVGTTRTAVRLQHVEPLHAGTQVLTLLPPSGPSGPVRVLVSPEGQVADGLLASNPTDGKPLRHAALGDDGVSGILPSPPGVPTCSRVVLLGLDAGYPGASGARVLYSGIMTAEMLAGMPDKVEVASPTLGPDRGALPETQWFADGAKLAAKVPGKGTLTVAALGPRLPARPLDSADKRVVSSRAYELHRAGGSAWVGSVVDVDGRTVCASAMPAGSPPEPTAWALRCPVPGEMMPGIVHVVGAPHAHSVEVDLQPTRSPAGQEPFGATASRAEDQPLDQAFAALLVAPMGFPCGVGTLRVHSGQAVTGASLPVYQP
jgi:Sigma-70, region 4